MKKILLITILLMFNILNSMKKQTEPTFEYWLDLPDEIKAEIIKLQVQQLI